MSRKDLYNKIKELGIAKAIEEKYKQNFTRVSNENLTNFIKKFEDKENPCNYDKVIIRLVSTLQANKMLTAADAEDILKML